MIWLFWSLSTVLIGLIYIFVTRTTRRKIPDGARESPIESGWPILGILPTMTNPLCHYFLKLGENLGNLYRVRFGMRNVFVLNNYKIIKKCLKDDGENFSGRWNGKLIEILSKNSGVMSIDGSVWDKHSTFTLKVLRDFGMGKSRTTEIVQEECRHLLLEIEGAENKSMDFSETMPIYTVNIISKFIMNKRYERYTDDYKLLTDIAHKLTQQKNNIQMFHLLFPFWDESTGLSKITFYLSSWKGIYDRVYDLFREEIRHHSKILDINSEGEDLMDRFLIERTKIIKKTGSDQTFTEFQLIRISFELFIAGFDTTSSTLEWSMLFLARYPEIQRKMHDEIIDNIGLHQLPSPNDKKSLPLTQAIMDEILRLSSVVPLSLIHRNFNDAVIDGIFIQGNSLIFPNLYAGHRDPQVWKKPLEFYPEHFLTTDVEGNLKYNPRDELIPFGLGKRKCMGESLARAEFFIFLVSIIQRFRVTFSKNISDEEYQNAMIGGFGLLRFSNIKDFIFEKYE